MTERPPNADVTIPADPALAADVLAGAREEPGEPEPAAGEPETEAGA